VENSIKILVLESSKELTRKINQVLRGSEISFISHRAKITSSLAENIRSFNPDVILANIDKINGRLSSTLSIAKKEGPNVPFICLSELPVIHSAELQKEGIADCVSNAQFSKLGITVKNAIDKVRGKEVLKNTEASLSIRLAQQSAVARLGQLALSTMDIDMIREEAVKLLSEYLPADFTNISELLPGNTELLVTAGTGWPDGVVRKTKINANEGSRSAFVLKSKAPIIVDDINSETRFNTPPHFFDLKIKSGISVIIKGKDITYGISSAHTIDKRSFTMEDINFLQSISNVLASALDNQQTENALRQSEANLKALTENTADAIWSVGLDHKVLTLNSAAKHLFFYSYGILFEKGMNFFDNKTIYSDKNLSDFNRIIEGEKLQHERMYLIEGELKIYEVNINPIFTDNGIITGAAYFSKDITGRKEAENEIKKSEERYRMLIETMHEGVVYLDKNDSILFANRRLCEMTGYSQPELINQKAATLLIANKDKGLMESKLQLRHKGIDDQYEIQLLCKNGTLKWTMVNGIPITDEDNIIIGSMATFTDISEIKKTESRLRATNQELNTFIYKSSHDLKGPLASIRGLTGLASNELVDVDSLHYLDLINQSANRLDTILSDLLETVRIKENAICAEEVDLALVVDDVIKNISSSKGFANLNITIDVPHKVFLTDLKIIDSIIHNILDNGIKYRDTTKSSNWIALNLNETANGIIIEIEDNGVGIPIALQEKVFDMFYRANLESKGTGLGLYIVKNAVEKLGGSITLYSEVGSGTKFIIDLPNISE
jgi:PAS domain S-box-containing protein